MKDIADHILDIAENSVRAKARKIAILLSINTRKNLMMLSFTDDGIGMDEDTVKKIQNPFFTTRGTRRVGMGIPLLMQNSEMSNGQVSISSCIGKGTTVTATFEYDNIDCPPLGNIADAVYFLSSSHLTIHFVFEYKFDNYSYVWDTQEVSAALDGLPLDHYMVKDALLEMLTANLVVDI